MRNSASIASEGHTRVKRTIRYARRHFTEILQGGISVLLRKLLASLYFFSITFLLPLVLLVRVMRPIVLVRFGALRSERLGHFTVNTEAYLCQRDLGIQDRQAIDIFFHSAPICNQQLKTMWDRTLHVSRLAKGLDRLSRMLPGGYAHVVPMPTDRDIHPIIGLTSVHLGFTTEEESLGRAALLELGIDDNTPFVCFHTRDSAYLATMHPDRDWSYHDYRDSSIQDYLAAAESLTQRGYHAIRMGDNVREALNVDNPSIIDYPFKGRSAFMDVYLLAKCRFLLASTSGVAGISQIFRVPLAVVNAIPLEYNPAGAQDIYIPKKLWLRRENRLMTFREILDSGASRFLHSEEYQELGIELVDNSPDEITALAIEMDERLNNTWEITQEDEYLQQSYWSLFDPSHLGYSSASRIGADFLRRNRDLLN